MTPVEKFTHADLVALGRDWLIKSFSAMAPYGHGGCSVVITEISANTWMGEKPDVIGFCNKKSILIECKTSLSDFNADKNKPFRKLSENGMGCQRWYLAPQGIIPTDKVPEKWGLLEVSSEYGEILVIKKPELQERNYDSEINILLSVMRRLKISKKDEHIGIKRYQKLNGFGESKKKAEFFIQEDVKK